MSTAPVLVRDAVHDALRDAARWLAWPVWNARERRLRALVRVIASLVVLALIGWGPQEAIARASAALADQREAHFSQGAVYLVWTFAVILAVALSARFLDRRPLDDLGLRVERGFGLDLAFGAALGGALMGGIMAIELALGLATYADPAELSGPLPRLVFVPTALLVFVGVAIWEELVFRGYHLTNLAEGLTGRWLSPASATVLAVVLSSAAFGLAHAGNPHADTMSSANIAIAGLMLGVGYVVSGDLAIPIGLHFGWNFFQNLLDMPVSGNTRYAIGALVEREATGPVWITGGEFGPEAGATGLVAMGVGTLAILAWVRWRRGALRVHPSFGVPPRLAR